jgi:hypothetical protein
LSDGVVFAPTGDLFGAELRQEEVRKLPAVAFPDPEAGVLKLAEDRRAAGLWGDRNQEKSGQRKMAICPKPIAVRGGCVM